MVYEYAVAFDDKCTGAIVVVMQRVHVGDLTGFLLAQSKEWDVLSLPPIADADEVIPVRRGRRYHRASGETLSPEHEPIDAAVDDRSALNCGHCPSARRKVHSTHSGS